MKRVLWTSLKTVVIRLLEFPDIIPLLNYQDRV